MVYETVTQTTSNCSFHRWLRMVIQKKNLGFAFFFQKWTCDIPKKSHHFWHVHSTSNLKLLQLRGATNGIQTASFHVADVTAQAVKLWLILQLVGLEIPAVLTSHGFHYVTSQLMNPWILKQKNISIKRCQSWYWKLYRNLWIAVPRLQVCFLNSTCGGRLGSSRVHWDVSCGSPHSLSTQMSTFY